MKAEEKAKLAEALGATRVLDVGRHRGGGPLDLLALREEFKQRLRSTGGRPTDPAWTINRQVPFKEESWARLQRLAGDVGAIGPRVGAAHLAALLIENGLEELEEAEWQDVLSESRGTSLLSAPEAAAAAKVTYNQFDDWVQRGWIGPGSGRRRQQTYGADDVIRAQVLREISQLPDAGDDLGEEVGRFDLAARYLVVTSARMVVAVHNRSQLLRLLAAPGGHLVIDQLPARRQLLGPPPLDDRHDEQRIRRAV